eukprot:8034901-Ditylum_brightwellii.AAC.1
MNTMEASVPQKWRAKMTHGSFGITTERQSSIKTIKGDCILYSNNTNHITNEFHTMKCHVKKIRAVKSDNTDESQYEKAMDNHLYQ